MNTEITSVVVKLDSIEKGILTPELKSYIVNGYEIIQTLPIEENGELFLLITLANNQTQENSYAKFFFFAIFLLIIQIIILSIGVYNGIY